eukprot:CAMPEP_0182422620 /NCGR_PEP_ID=MMETSP1167-20130531/8349_1 /TAXON_ID=2988 /ORGANISM="Mallomonas Sp, Strain CCMP3275" /LENGTH=300 /DNA_ID=CAMNT_0024600813 /DNA_START=117 /DNA_END=1019 /DNA_ORIENTATION=-
MQAPRAGNGADFNPNAPYRMYHGDRIPGFPQHPHRGFETITATIDGIVDHTDSLGNAGRYGQGDLQWMTAGKGIVHGEMFPLINQTSPNPTKFFQIWLNLPARNKMVEPAFVMHWAPDIPKYISPDNLTHITVWAGSLFGLTGMTPTPNSWAQQPENEVAVWYLNMSPGARLSLPAAEGGRAINRMLYYLEGSHLSVGDRSLDAHCIVTLDAGQAADLYNAHNKEHTEVLILQGRPISEPVAQHGPFVMNTNQEIEKAFSDYRKTRFGGWPWPDDAMIFPREKRRFALQNGVESNPFKIE